MWAFVFEGTVVEVPLVVVLKLVVEEVEAVLLAVVEVEVAEVVDVEEVEVVLVEPGVVTTVLEIEEVEYEE